NNAKALSPVVASIILIAVTVAVSVAVAAWMGGMTLGFMQTEQVKVQTPSFDTTAKTVTIDVSNSGTQAVVLSKVSINGIDVTTASDLAAPYTLQANKDVVIVIDGQNSNYPATAPGITAGNNYQVTVTTSKGNQFSISAVAPQ
ncbi:MAG TPA: archaellin/type IV pilin N-terminal domain-containing protein, partial [Candidatus Nanoarchaeia archaeon]|nr:archaellin/type IV pilin N-terminal domain-containing protein [Candidatus Nanoarchaeia archaeon]